MRRLPDGYTDALCAYVIAEKEKLDSDNRMKDLSSHVPGGKQTVVATFVALERFRAKVRWGDFISAIHEDVVVGSSLTTHASAQQDLSE
jgi:hypothetical protein